MQGYTEAQVFPVASELDLNNDNNSNKLKGKITNY